MELYQIRTFVTVANEGHLTRAAKRLCTSQPAVSAHIKALENEFGMALFQRSPKGMVLTKEGRLLRKQAEKILLESEKLLHEARRLQGHLAGDVSIGLNTDPEFLKTSQFFGVMRERYPGLDFHLSQNMSGKILADLVSGKLDAGYIFGDREFPEVDGLLLSTYKLLVVGPAIWHDQLQAADWNALAELPWIGNPPLCPFHKIIRGMFGRRNLKPPIAVVVDQEAAIKSMVTSGVGLTLMIEKEARLARQEGKIAIWEKENLDIGLSFVYLKKRRNDPVIAALLCGICEVWGISPPGQSGKPDVTGQASACP